MILDWLAKLDRRERIGLTVAVLAILGLLVDRLAVQSVVSRSRELSRDVARQRAALVYQRRLLARQDSVTDAHRRLVSLMESVQSEAEGIDRMKDQIDALAQAAGVRLDAWEERRPEAREGYDEHFVVIRQFESDVDGILRFLHDLQAAPGLLRVDELRVGPMRDSKRLRGSLLISKVVRTAEAVGTGGVTR